MSSNKTTHASKQGVDDAVSALIQQVGHRVRSVRQSQGLSRRVLSERSGVSPRYLATLEGGEGNISVGLLTKLALALDTRVEYFLSHGELIRSPESRRILELFEQADATTQASVLHLLDPHNVSAQKQERLCLVGLRGAGKSTLGALMSAAYAAPFIELNTELSRRAGMPVAEIIALYGQEGYRQLEADTLLTIIASYDRAVVAVAGGIVSDKTTFQNVLSRFHTVWLKTSPDEHMQRVQAQGDLRPMQGHPEAMTQLRGILKAREVLYAQADHVLDSTGKTVEQSQVELSGIIDEHQILSSG